MTSQYKVAAGHGVALVDLDLIDPQPHSEGVKATQRTYGLTGAPHEIGSYIELEWDLVGSVAAYQSLLTQFGLASALSASVTIYVPGPTFTYTRYNGLAIRPQVGTDVRRANYFPRSIVILVRNLETP